MTGEQRTAIVGYIEKVGREWRSGQATEHTYRPMLKELVETLLPRVVAVNEPKHIDCGAPDYLLRRGSDILGFIEAKDVGDGDLDGRAAHKEQFDRYKDSLDTLCFTDYLDFHFYDHSDFVDSVRVAEAKGDRLAASDDATLDRFVQLVSRFAEARPQHIASPARLAQLMAGKARLLAQGVRRYLGNAENAGSMLAQQMEAFRNVLIHDIDADAFADIFAQTVTYGMFAARLHDPTPEDFSRAEAATLIPKTNPLLRQMFQYIAMDTDDSIEWIVDDLVSLFASVDVEGLMKGYGAETQKTDPLLHFYEDFLAAYDPKLRKVRGVWNTPTPVVGFIVRAVDRILERDFALPGGLADPSKTKVMVVNDAKAKKSDRAFVEREVHRVQMLDPAAGTGTFLAETVKLIHAKVVAAMGEGAWQGYVAESLLPRLNGFEILMASYAMAHLKLDRLLSETGYEHRTNERLRVFLTNSLEPYDKEIGTLFAAALSREANEANFVKRDCPVMVVMGNPPYSGVSSNNGEWATHLIDDYKKEPNSDQPLQERKHWLNDDYVKFLSFAQHYIDKNGEGVVAFVNNNGFLGNPTFRGMRWSLLKSFDEIYVLNLHGDAKKKEVAPDGSKDDNVFDITQGVSINIFVKRGVRNRTVAVSATGAVTAGPLASACRGDRDGTVKFATVHYADLYGVREDKYAFLDVNTLESVKWQTLAMQEPYYFFVPKDFGLQEEYEKGFSIAELMHEQSMGTVSANDDLNISITEHEQREKIKDLLTLQEGDWRQKTGREKDSRDWTYATARADVAEHGESVQKISYRPFDNRFTCYTGKSRGLYSSPQQKIMSHFLKGENLGLCALRICSRDDSLPVFVTDKITDKTILSSKDNANVFPLYLYETSEANLIQVKGKVSRRPNFDAAIFAKICAAVNYAPCLQASANTVRNGTVAVAAPSAIREFLCGEPVARLTGHEFEDVMGIKALKQVIYDSYAQVGWCVDRSDVGHIRLTRSGINDSLCHGFGRVKIAAFSVLPELILKGMVVRHSKNWKGRGYESFVLVAPIEVGAIAYCAFIVVNSIKGGGYRFYLHEVGRLEDIKIAGGMRTGFADRSVLSRTPGSVKSVSKSAVHVNGTKVAEELRSGLAPCRGEVNPPFGDIRSLAYSIFAVNGGAENFRPTPEDVFNYIYGVLHTPSYRERYREFLKIDFPRIPYPKDAAEFRRVAAVGEKLVKVHLLKDEAVTNPFANPYAKFAGAGDGIVEKVVFQSCTSGEDAASPLTSGEDAVSPFGRVYVNGGQWFESVPEAAWNFYVGGYQPVQKWLKDRKGRALTAEDQQHYRAIIAALVKTAALMRELELGNEELGIKNEELKE